jgi:hypothetical protein
MLGTHSIQCSITPLTGLSADPLAGQWIVRLVLSLLCWPASDPTAERALVEHYVLGDDGVRRSSQVLFEVFRRPGRYGR